MAPIAIVTDSTVNLPKSYIREYSITVAPQIVIWDGETYEDGISIHAKEFYERLKISPTSPTTSQVSQVTMKNIFEKLLAQGNEILCITVSSKLSGTMNSAVQAKEMLPGAPIVLVNSYMASLALGYQVLQAARAIQNGASMKETIALLERAKSNTGAFFVVDTLDYLHRGGRIGNAAHLLGTALNLKPILQLKNGMIEAAAKVRTQKKAIERMYTLLENELAHSRQNRLGILHANAPVEAQLVLQECQRRFTPNEIMITEVSPVIGTHTGPGTIGIAFMRDM